MAYMANRRYTAKENTNKMSDVQRRAIYGMAISLGIYEKGNKYDNFHALVLRVTHKPSVSELTVSDANKVIAELDRLGGYEMMQKTAEQKKKAVRRDYSKRELNSKRDGMIEPSQSKKVWAMMYKLKELDLENSNTALADRLCGIIEKHLGITANSKDPFRFVTYEKATTLIEVMKKIVVYYERKAKEGTK